MKKHLLLLALIPAVSSCAMLFGEYTYEDAEKYRQLDSTTLTMDLITTLNVGWHDGEINIYNSNSESIKIEETETNCPLYYYAENSVLYVQYCKSGTSEADLNAIKGGKKLDIYLPVTAIAANITNVTGNLKADSLTVPTLIYSCVTGGVEVGTLSSKVFMVNTVTGNMKVDHVEAESQISFNLVSGDGNIAVNKDLGYETTFSALTGKLNGDTEYGNKKVKIDFAAVTGNLTMSVY